MKKTTSLLLMLFLSALGMAQVLNEPANWPNSSWTITGTYSTATGVFEANPTVASNFAYDDNGAGSGSNNTIAAESPVTDLTAAFNAGEIWIYFSGQYVFNKQNTDILAVQYWDADAAAWVNWGAPFTADTPGVGNNNYCANTALSYTSPLLDITAFTATQLAGFKYRIYYTDSGIWAKGFCFSSPTVYSDAPPTCPDLSGVAVTAIAYNSVTFTWTAGGSETAWDVAVQPAGTGVPTSGWMPAGPTSTYTWTPLDPITPYEIYVRANCGAGDYSNWVGPVNFTTYNTPPIPPDGVACPTSSYIFTEDFDTPGFWTGNINTNGGSWEIPNGSTSANTGANTAYSGSSFMNFEATNSSPTPLPPGSIVSPAIDLNGATGEIEMSFYMHAYGASMGTLEVGVGTSPTGPFTTEFTWVGQLQTSGTQPWVPVGVDLTAYANQIIYIQFKQTVATPNTGTGDMSIDYLRIQACGSFCVAPSGITAYDLTDVGGMLTWTPNNGESAWYYVVQPAGTGVPTGTGTLVTSLPIDLSTITPALTPDTEYEVYVMAACGGGFNSIWSNPYTFRTEIQTVFDVDCIVGPTNVNFCYENNDNTIFQFTASDAAQYLTVTFNSGMTELGDDELIVYDSDGTTVLYTGYGNAGNLAGLTFTSTGPMIYVAVTSDGSNSCATGGVDGPWDFTVKCATCLNPAATYTVVNDCDNDLYSINVDVTSLGDAASLTLTDNQGSPAQVVTTTGVYTFGPFANGNYTVITVANSDDNNCVIVSSAMAQTECPPEEDFLCTTLEVSEDATFECGNSSDIPLDADFFLMGTNTTSYVLSDVQCTPDVLPGTPTNLVTDDLYTSAIDIGFNFCFFGNTYNQVVIGSNGVVSFDTSLAGLFCPWAFTASLPSNQLPMNSILGVYHDMNPSVCGNIEYILSGTAPNRTFTVNFSSVCQFSCTNLISTSQVVLYEATGAIEINIIDRPTCAGWNSGNAVAGIQNSTGTIAYYPPGRNTGVWDAQNESWRYLPDGLPNYTFEWFDGTTSLGNDPHITVSPSATTTYTAVLSYNKCDGTLATLTDDVTYTIENGVVANDVADMIACDDTVIDGMTTFDLTTQDAAIIGGQAGITVLYYTSMDDADMGVNAITVMPYTNTVPDTQTIYAKASLTGSNCYDITTFDLIVNPTPDVNFGGSNSITKSYCDDVTLVGNVANLADLSGNLTYTWYDDDVQIQTGTDNTLLLAEGSDIEGVISLTVTDTDTGCSTTEDMQVTIVGDITAAQPADMEACDDISNDGYLQFELTNQNASIINGQADVAVSYYTSAANAEAGTGALSSPYTNTTPYVQTIYARLEHTPTGCYDMVAFDLIVHDTPILLFENYYEVCSNGVTPTILTGQNVDFELTDPGVSIVWTQDGVVIPGATSNELSVLDAGIYAVEVSTADCTNYYEITVHEASGCIIPQGISPGTGDTTNERFDLDGFDIAHIAIFNRLGTEVYTKSNYTDEWYGQTDKGEELPVGTYFYVLTQGNGNKITGWVYVNRKN